MSTPALPPGVSPQEILALQNAPALTEIKIGGTVYKLGELSDQQRDDLRAWGERIIDYSTTGAAMPPQDQDPSRVLQHMLYAGHPGFEFDAVRFQITSEHSARAAREYLRREVVHALDPSHMAGKA